jgi:SsrA-binding protein
MAIASDLVWGRALHAAFLGSEMAGKQGPPSVVADNRKARHDYDIDESFEAGIVLTGSEIKSVRAGRVQLRGSYARIYNDEIYLYEAHISPYEQSGTYFNHEPTRPRKLLLHRREISRIDGLIRQKGMTLVPLKIYFKGRRAKVELGIARGKKSYDKREDIAKRDAQRDIERAMKSRTRD